MDRLKLYLHSAETRGAPLHPGEYSLRKLPEDPRLGLLMDGSNETPPVAEEFVTAFRGWNASTGREIPIVHWVIMSISPLGFAENSFLLWFLCFRMKRNPFIVYITHLSIADISLLFGMFVLSVDYAFDYKLSSGYHYTIITLSVTFLFGYNTGLYLLTAISVERCLSVLYPLWYRCQRHKHQSAFVCALLWALSCLVTLMEYAMCMDNRGQGHSRSDCRAVIIFIAILSFLVFTPLMLVSSTILVFKIRKKRRTSESSKLYLVILVSIAGFLIFAVPMRLHYLFYYEYWPMLRDLHHLGLLSSTISSSINPLIYFFVGSSKKKWFKESLKVVLTRAFKDELQPRRQEDNDNTITMETAL
ncbi:proto-oncogene Mas-like [Rhynchocyon petersi]